MPKKHGRRNTSEYWAWSMMKDRCMNPRSHAWHNYGGRGIKVCDRWCKSFVAFLEDMGMKPAKGYDLSRIDNDGGYTPTNCEWALRKKNIRNTRVNLMIEIDGVSKCAGEWSELIGAERHVVARRYRKGWRGTALLKPSRRWRTKARSAVITDPQQIIDILK